MIFEPARKFLSGLPRVWKGVILAGFDFLALSAVLLLAYQLRLGPAFQPSAVQLGLMALAPAVALPVFLRLGLYRAVIRYLPERAIWTILWAMLLATLIWVFLLFLAEASRIAVLPRSVPIFYFLAGSLIIVGSRFAAKYLLWLPVRRRAPRREVLIYGAGEAGRELATALRVHGAGYVAGFIDADPSLAGRDVAGVRVFPPSRLENLIRDFGVREVILSMPSIGAEQRQAIFADLNRFAVKIRTLPAISDIASGKYSVGQLPEMDIDELLGRSSVPADPQLLQGMIEGRSILVSGAGGSIGSELCRIIAQLAPQRLVLLEASEFALYQIERQLRGQTDFAVVPVLGSVTSDRLVRRALTENAVEAVFHAAAHKHVPLVEANPLEGVRNNVFGTRTIAQAAHEAGVRDFVLISTDKAVRPTNVMGATKRWAELIMRHYGQLAEAGGTGQRYCAVRFGNVLGSNGSVVPLFREQIASGGPVTLTDERMTRYFMSIHEAAELIVQAGALSDGRDIFLLEMGDPVRIRDLAENMIRLAGLTVRSEQNPLGDIAISVTGARPGEKLFEELFYDAAQAERTRQPKILRSTQEDIANGDLETALGALEAALEAGDEAQLRQVLFDFIGK